MARTLDRLTVLTAIFSNFQMATQWPDGGDKYFHEATSLIELLEVVDCGSTGGFDKSNPHQRITGCDSFDRFLTLLRKEGDAKNIEPSCGADVSTLVAYFAKLMALRSEIYNQFPAPKNA